MLDSSALSDSRNMHIKTVHNIGASIEIANHFALRLSCEIENIPTHIIVIASSNMSKDMLRKSMCIFYHEESNYHNLLLANRNPQHAGGS